MPRRFEALIEIIAFLEMTTLHTCMSEHKSLNCWDMNIRILGLGFELGLDYCSFFHFYYFFRLKRAISNYNLRKQVRLIVQLQGKSPNAKHLTFYLKITELLKFKPQKNIITYSNDRFLNHYVVVDQKMNFSPCLEIIHSLFWNYKKRIRW